MPSYTPTIKISSWIGKNGKQMGCFRYEDSRKYKSHGYSVAMPLETAICIARELAALHGAALI